MKANLLKGWMAVVAALCLVACSDDAKVDEGGGVQPSVRYVPFHASLSSGEVAEEADSETRMMVGEITSSKVYFHWDERDSIGAFLLNVPTEAGNHYAMSARNDGNFNAAKFDLEARVPEGTKVGNLHAYLYYPYNSSMVQPVAGKTGGEYLGEGFVVRIPNKQVQLPDEMGEMGCTQAMSRYAVAYDLLACEGTSGTFNMQHRTAYFRFKISGGDGTDGNSYNTDKYRLKRLTVQAGTRTEVVNEQGETRYKITDPLYLAGTYRMAFDYDEATFNEQQKMRLISWGGATYVTTELLESQPLDNPCYVFLSLSPEALKVAEANTDRYMQVEMEVECYDDNGELAQIVSCTRFIPLTGRSVQASGLYDVSLTFSAPLDTYMPLDAEEPANCYIVPAGGSYLFSAETPGNGVTPYNTTWSDLAAEGILPNQIEEGEEYGVDWLWASGTLFESSSVEDVLQDLTFDPTDNTILFTINPSIAASSLKGNIVLALYKKDSEGNFKEIVWSWLLWLSQPQDHYFNFANTRPGVDLNNSEWYVLDRNIGAEEAGFGIRSVGLYYQMGRKDPFVGPSYRGTITPYYTAGSTDSSGNTTAAVLYVAENGNYTAAWAENRLATLCNTAVFGADVASWQSGISQSGEVLPCRYPMHLFSRTTEQLSSSARLYAWVHSAEQAATQTKTLFDPCPPGYKLPTTREWDNLKNSRYEFTTPESTGFGPFGSAHYHYNGTYAYPPYSDSPWNWPVSTNGIQHTFYAYYETKARCDAGEYYEVDYENGSEGYGTMGRLYHMPSKSVAGMENVYLPSTGALTDTGEFVQLATNITLWSSGRIDETYNVFEGYWFGIKGNAETNYADNKADWWGTWESEVWAFYLPSLFTNPFGASSAGLAQPTLYYENGVVNGKATTINYGAPVRCIRTYNASADASGLR